MHALLTNLTPNDTVTKARALFAERAALFRPGEYKFHVCSGKNSYLVRIEEEKAWFMWNGEMQEVPVIRGNKLPILPISRVK